MKPAKPNRARTLISHPILLCLTCFSGCFILALMLFLPLDPFARQVEQWAKSQNIQLSIEQPELSFPPGVGAERIIIDMKPFPHPPVQLKNVALRPLWLSLLGKNQGISFVLKTFQGKISGTAHRDGRVAVTLTDLRLNESLGPQLPLTLTGILRMGKFTGQLPFSGKNQNHLQLELNQLALKGMQNLGSEGDLLPIGTLTLNAEAKGPLVQIRNLSSRGPAFELQGSGSLRLGRIAANSSLNLKLILTPKSALDPALKDLLSLMKKPQANGSYNFSLRGPLANLRIN